MKKKFRLNLRQIIKDDHTPFYKLELTKDDLVIVRHRQPKKMLTANIVIPAWAEEKARKIAREKGWDYYALEREWLGYAKSGELPENPGAAFVGFCKKKERLR